MIHGLARCAALCALAFLARVPADAAEIVATPPASVSVAKKLGDRFSYEAAWSPVLLKDEQGKPAAFISSFSYVRADAGDAAKRPVLFVWGGGPGSAAGHALGFALGPKTSLGKDDESAPVVDNPNTILDVADLVFVDPVGTGFSRPVVPGGGMAYWGVKGDARSFEQLIRAWLAERGRSSSPIFLMGESYGGYRLGEVAALLHDLPVAGFVAVSPGFDLTQMAGDTSLISGDPSWIGGIANDQAFIVNLPAMAVAAATHKRVQGGRSIEAVHAEARSFAQGAYATALQKGSALGAAERDRVAERMSKLIGVPAAAIAKANLRLQSQDFLELVVPGQVVGRLDSRIVAPKRKDVSIPGQTKAIDDPSLALGNSTVKKSATITRYFRDEIGVKAEDEYVTLNLDVNFPWDWSHQTGKLEDNIVGLNATPLVAQTMRAKPDCRLLVMSGYYDLAVSADAAQAAVFHGGVPLDRTTMKIYPTGHFVFAAANLNRAIQDLRAFIVGKN